MDKAVLYIVIPCYNEEEVLPVSAPRFLKKLGEMIAAGKISDESRIMLVDDGSRDKTWSIISSFAESDRHFMGIRQSRNRGHQNALLAGLMESKDRCDITISMDCDGQDDIDAAEKMVDEYYAGSEIVYGVRSSRDTDSFFKRTTARAYYKFLRKMGAEVVYESGTALHVTGHACQEELKIILGIVKPKYFIPVHGEQKHLQKHAELGISMGHKLIALFRCRIQGDGIIHLIIRAKGNLLVTAIDGR